MVECGSQESRIHDSRRGHKRISHQGEQMSVQRQQSKEQTRIRYRRIGLENRKDTEEDRDGDERLLAQSD